MKAALENLVTQALRELSSAGVLPENAELPPLSIERCRDRAHGDFACPVAMALARIAKRNPREIAQALVAALPPDPLVEDVDIAGPGFINFRLAPVAFQRLVGEVLDAGARYGCSTRGAGTKIQVEFVSSNPTGPLHVGHGRGAAYGAVVANLLRAVGHQVECEYYVNDAGRQMDILALSVWLRYLGRDGAALAFPEKAYQGDYIHTVASELANLHGRDLERPIADLPASSGDPEADIDTLIAHARRTLGEDGWRQVSDHALEAIRADIEADLHEFGVDFDVWFSERSLIDSGALDRALEGLEANGHTYREGGALWFRSTTFGDEKDRVLVRENGLSTYFASDVAYHLNKLERGFDTLIDVWGADHHGYISRVRGSLAGLARDPDALEVLWVQLANLYRGGEKVAMSTRSGEFVTLRELRDEVGGDAARFFYVVRKSDQHLDFDLDLAKSQSNDNPVYYIQYAHARVCSVLREQAQGAGEPWSDRLGVEAAGHLVEPQEMALLKTLSRFPEVVESAAEQREPHQMAFYLRDVANDFHTYYNAHKFLVEAPEVRNARLGLARATQVVIHNGLALLGVSAPESM